MAYDASDGYALVFGGLNGSGPYTPLTDTWAFEHGGWIRLYPASSPPWLVGAAMAYDAADGYVVLFGGQEYYSPGQFTDSDQTWTFHSGSWTNLTAPLRLSPGGRTGMAMSYDPSARAVVLFGGEDEVGQTLNDTWEFHGGNWSELTPSVSPPPTYWAAAAYSSSVAGTVLFGGQSPGISNQTWVLADGNWTNDTGAVDPSARYAGSMAPYDAQGDLVLYGGAGAPGGTSFPNDTWVFSGGNWSRVPLGLHPIVGTSSDMVADPEGGYVLLFGGYDHPPGALAPGYSSNGTWAFGPPLLGSIVATPNPLDAGQSLAFADPYENRTSPYSLNWSLGDGNTSAQASFVHTYGLPGAYLVSLAARDAAGDYNNSTSWVAVNPDPEVDISASSNATDVGVTVNFTATPINGTAPFRLNWTFGDGNVTSGPSVTHAYSAPGEFTVTVSANDSVGTLREATTTIDVVARPTAGLDVNRAALDVGEVLVITTVVSNGSVPYGYSYSGLPTGCSGTATAQVTCRPTTAGNFSISAVVSDRDGVSGGTLPVLVRVTALPAAALSISRAVIDVGQTVTVAEHTLSSGAGGLTFDVAGLPPGCAAPTALPFICSPTTAGNYSFTLNVTDAAGGTNQSAAVSLTVNPRLGVAWAAGPALNLTVYGTTELSVAVTGGTVPFTIEYLGLPTGCPTANSSAITCTPSATGNFTTYVRVTDSVGAVAQSEVNLTVGYPPPQPVAGTDWPFVDAGLGAASVIVVIASALVMRGRRRRREPSVGEQVPTEE